MISINSLKLGKIISAILAIVLATSSMTCVLLKTARANEASNSATEFTLRIEDLGVETGTTYYSDYMTRFNDGDPAYLHLKGESINSYNLVIPVSVRYGNTVISKDQLLNFASIHEVNTEYKRLMGQNCTYLTYSKLLDYILTGININIGPLTASTSEIFVTWQEVAPVYRLYNKVTSEHLFTTNKVEYDRWVSKCQSNEDNWIGEGINWLAPVSGKQVHRLYNAGLGAMGRSSHYYTSDASEMNRLVSKNGWKDDGIENGFMSGGDTGIYTCYNENLGSAHHYTSNKSEWQNLDRHGWNLEKDKNQNNGAFQGITNASYGAELSNNTTGPYSYWLAPSSSIITGSYSTKIIAPINNTNYVSPESGIVMTNTQIQSDVAILKAGTSNKSYTSVKTKWENYMKNDNFHLYTKVSNNGNPNDYVEFRVVQVGAHEANGKSDGSVLTFQACHTLTTPFSMNTNNTTRGGYSKSLLRSELKSGKVYRMFSSGLTKDIKAVTKYSGNGATATGEMDYSVTGSSEKLWFMSISEIVPNTLSFLSDKGYDKEGVQYTFWKSKGLFTKTNITNGICEGITEKRSEHFEAYPGVYGTWLRSAISDSYFAGLSNGFKFSDEYGIGWAYGGSSFSLTLCFCF